MMGRWRAAELAVREDVERRLNLGELRELCLALWGSAYKSLESASEARVRVLAVRAFIQDYIILVVCLRAHSFCFN